MGNSMTAFPLSLALRMFCFVLFYASRTRHPIQDSPTLHYFPSININGISSHSQNFPNRAINHVVTPCLYNSVYQNYSANFQISRVLYEKRGKKYFGNICMYHQSSYMFTKNINENFCRKEICFILLILLFFKLLKSWKYPVFQGKQLEILSFGKRA